MRYCKFVDEAGKVIGIGTGNGGTEITVAEYNHLKSDQVKMAAHVDAVYADPLKIDAAPPEWRDEILRRVEERRQAEQEAQNADVSPDELGQMLMEVL